MRDYSTRTFGKWILAGEHAVLRGCPALAFPLTSKALELVYRFVDCPVEVSFRGTHGQELNLLFYGVIENAMSRLRISDPLRGRFEISSELPVGAGLGASAAVCGAVARWCFGQGWIAEDEIYEFARSLEDLFHGESSGVDLAVSLSAQGVCFQRGKPHISIRPAWWPHLYLSYCGSRGMTSDCVAKVKRMFDSQKDFARLMDAQMEQAVHLAQLALSRDDQQARIDLLQAIELARDCFDRWGLSGGDLGEHMQRLRQSGALAVKPTGSGGGGFVLSFWETKPGADIIGDLIQIPEPHL